MGNKQIEEENNAKERIRKALRNIDDYVKSRSRELANSWADGLKLHFSDISTYGVGRPWGTEIRQRLATAFGLKKEVNSLWELGSEFFGKLSTCLLGRTFHWADQTRSCYGKNKRTYYKEGNFGY
ncbi:MAG: hypothetical protein L6W00_10150 [Lentisphaeria bacterium]|nr:MAG: hypothetical protein L6W00_10150 [Lentisphaeria bacterium]